VKASQPLRFLVIRREAGLAFVGETTLGFREATFGWGFEPERRRVLAPDLAEGLSGVGGGSTIGISNWPTVSVSSSGK